jgi:hypothetical protein
MKAIHWIIAAAALACTEPVRAGVNDPEVIIYRFPGVLHIGFIPNAGVATVFHCTNFSGVPENIRVVVRASDGGLLANVLTTVPHLATNTFSTNTTNLYTDNNNLQTGMVTQGTAAIAATSVSVICTAVTIDAQAIVPNGFALRGIRFSPVPGSQE